MKNFIPKMGYFAFMVTHVVKYENCYSITTKKGGMKPKSTKYEDYSTEDFIADEFFIEWIHAKTKASISFWEEWLRLHPGKALEVSEARNILQSVKYKNYEPLSDKEELDLYESILKKKAIVHESISNAHSIAYAYKVAAIITLLIISVFGFYKISTYSVKEEASVVEVSWVNSQNYKGKKSTIYLPDGSTIWLNSESKLRYPKKFIGKERRVYLDGEAFFDISPNPAMPFIIETGNIHTKVVGTSFNISHDQKNNVQVVVASGLVEIVEQDSNTTIKLSPNQAVDYKKSDQRLDKYHVENVEEIICWKKGILMFKSTPFDEVCERLESWYGVEISLAKNFKKPGKYSGTYHNKSLKKVLEGMSHVQQFDFELNGKTVLIKNK